MKKRHVLLLSVPVVAGIMYLRSFVSWLPHKLFNGAGAVSDLVFSSDGKTLLVTQTNSSSPSGTLREITALDATHGFVAKWSYQDGSELARPQFYLSDSRVLVAGMSIRILDAQTGERLSVQGSRSQAVASPDGKWLAYNNLSIMHGDVAFKLADSPQDIFLDRSARISTDHRGKFDHIIKGERSLNSTYLFSPDGQTFVVNGIIYDEGGRRSRLDVYDVKTWKRIRFWWSDDTEEQAPNSTNVLISRNGRFLLCITYFYDGNPKLIKAKVSLWRLADGKKLSSHSFPATIQLLMTESSFRMPSFEVQNDGRVLQFGLNGLVSLSKSTDLSAGFQQLPSIPLETTTAATLSPDGSYLIAGTQSGRVFWQRLK